MADYGWGSAPQTAGGHVAPPTQAEGAFDTAEMQQALPATGDNRPVREAPDGWVQATPYNYEEYGEGGSAEWASNAQVYEWDGEAGDIGPEFPALEVELFGEPGNRGKQGIDFGK